MPKLCRKAVVTPAKSRTPVCGKRYANRFGNTFGNLPDTLPIRLYALAWDIAFKSA